MRSLGNRGKPVAARRFGVRGGFTLVEFMVAMMVLAAMVVIFAGSVVMAQKAAHVNGQYAQAISLCQHKIDQLRAYGFGKLNYTELRDSGVIDTSPSTSPYSFTVVDEVSQCLHDPVTGLELETISTKVIKVTTTVTWKNTRYESKTSTMSLSALVANVE